MMMAGRIGIDRLNQAAEAVEERAAMEAARAFYNTMKPWMPMTAAVDWDRLSDHIRDAFRAAAKAAREV